MKLEGIPKKAELLSIQYLRGLAAIAVFIFHLGRSYNFEFVVGEAGVDVFFVISGFVMWLTTYGSPMTFIAFMSKRIKRLVPLYWIVTLVTAAFAVVKPHFFWGIEVNAEGLFQSLLFIPYYATSDNLWPIVMQGWTLNLEMFFYLIFGAALVVGLPQRLYTLTVALLLLVASGYVIEFTNPVLATWTRPYLLEFLAGVWLAHFYTQNRFYGLRWGRLLFVIGVSTLAIIHLTGHVPKELRIVLFGLPAIVLVAGALMLESAGNVPFIKSLKILGDASYSIYLWHYLVIVIIGAICLRLGLTSDVILTAISFVMGLPILWLSYWLIERNIVNYFKRKDIIKSL